MKEHLKAKEFDQEAGRLISHSHKDIVQINWADLNLLKTIEQI